MISKKMKPRAPGLVLKPCPPDKQDTLSYTSSKLPLVEKQYAMAKKRKEQMQSLYEKAVERFEKIEEERARLRCLERAAMRDMNLQTGGLPPDYSEDEMSYPEKNKKNLQPAWFFSIKALTSSESSSEAIQSKAIAVTLATRSSPPVV